MGGGTIRIEDHVLVLSFAKLRLLTMLRTAQAEGKLLSSDDIIKGMYFRENIDRQVLLNRAKVHIHQLRKILKNTGLKISCHYKLGYFLVDAKDEKC